MATSKKPRAKAVTRGAKNAKKKTHAKAKKTAPRAAKKAVRTAKAPAPPVLKERRKNPESLRLKSYTPSLTVNDLSKSIAFYTEGLGFFVGEKWTDGDVVRGVMLKAGGCEFGLSQDDWKLGKDRKKGEGFRIWCDTGQDLDVLAARIKRAGFTLTEEVEDHPAWGVRSFSLDDPDGFHLTFAKSLTAA